MYVVFFCDDRSAILVLPCADGRGAQSAIKKGEKNPSFVTRKIYASAKVCIAHHQEEEAELELPPSFFHLISGAHCVLKSFLSSMRLHGRRRRRRRREGERENSPCVAFFHSSHSSLCRLLLRSTRHKIGSPCFSAKIGRGGERRRRKEKRSFFLRLHFSLSFLAILGRSSPISRPPQFSWQ